MPCLWPGPLLGLFCSISSIIYLYVLSCHYLCFISFYWFVYKHLGVMIQIKPEVRLVPWNMLKPSSIFADRSKGLLVLWIILFIYVSCLSLLCCRVCFLQPYLHLLGKGWPLGFIVYCGFVTTPYGVSGQGWNLIVLIPDLCLPFYFYLHLCNKKLRTEIQMMICTTAMAPAMFATKEWQQNQS